MVEFSFNYLNSRLSLFAGHEDEKTGGPEQLFENKVKLQVASELSQETENMSPCL